MDWIHRKKLHLEALTRLPAPSRGTQLDLVELQPADLPVSPDDVMLSGRFLDRFDVASPLMVSSMTGGIPDAVPLNQALADMCLQKRIPMATGSMSPYVKHGVTDGFDLKKGRPGLILGGNLGAILVAEKGPGVLDDIVARFDLDFVCVHINALHELAQPEGDRNLSLIREGVATAMLWSRDQNVPVVVKEVGHGFSRNQLKSLKKLGATWVDVAGAGGTDFLEIELLRQDHPQRDVLEPLRGWGTPTAQTTAWAHQEGFGVIASGGIRNGLDGVKSLALGASTVAMAAPWALAFMESGMAGITRVHDTFVTQMKFTMALLGIGSVTSISSALPSHPWTRTDRHS